MRIIREAAGEPLPPRSGLPGQLRTAQPPDDLRRNLLGSEHWGLQVSADFVPDAAETTVSAFMRASRGSFGQALECSLHDDLDGDEPTSVVTIEVSVVALTGD